MSEIAYRAWLEAQAGHPISDAEFAATYSRVESDWMHAVETAVRERIARDIVERAGIDPLLGDCADHPGRENHCASGYCAWCWLCRERGVSPDLELAYSEGLRSGERRAANVARSPR